MAGINKLKQQIDEKKSHVILGIDPTDDMKEDIEKAGGLEQYIKGLIDQTGEYIVGIKPNLAFFEGSEYSRKIMGKCMGYAASKNLVTILDAKRGDIMSTQTMYAEADEANFNPDIATIHAYSGADAIKPYLDEDIDTIIMAAMSNPGAKLQDRISGGLRMYQHMALDAHEIGGDRTGFVVGATKVQAMKDIRMAEKEHDLEPGMVLAPGFGRQGGSLDFVSIAGKNAVYPISSGLTNPKYLNGRTPAEAAKDWRDAINTELEDTKDIPSITQHVVDSMIKEGLIIIPESPDVVTWPLLKKGREKLAGADIDIKGLSDSERQDLLQEKLTDGTLNQDDFAGPMNPFMNIRNVSKSPETQRYLAFLYKKKIEESGVEYDQIGSVAYGAVATGDTVAGYLEKPSFLLRKERGAEATHDDIVGSIKAGETAIMIEDVTTSADSLIKDVEMLRQKYGANITDAFVFCKRTDEGEDNCRKHDINLHYICDMDKLSDMIARSKYVPDAIKATMTGSGSD